MSSLYRISLSVHLIKEFRKMTKEFDDLSAAVDALVAADETENALLAAIKAQLDAILGNPGGVSATEVTALRDKVAAELAKVNAAIDAASPKPDPTA